MWKSSFRMAAATSMLSGLVSVQACDPSVASLENVDISPFVTPELARRLDAGGRFVLSTGDRRPEDSEITEKQARDLGKDWASRYIHLEQRSLEDRHGGPIKLKELAPCGRVYYARSAFVAPPPSVPAPFTRGVGSWWLMAMCSGRQPQVWLSVSARSAALWSVFHAGGTHRSEIGGEFVPIGIPGGRLDEVILAPEQAVQMVSEMTGELVASEPELVVGRDGPEWWAWSVEVSQPGRVAAKETGAVMMSSIFLVGRFYDREAMRVLSLGPTLAIPHTEQPPGIDVTYFEPGGRTSRPEDRVVPVGLRAGAALRVILVDRYTAQQ